MLILLLLQILFLDQSNASLFILNDCTFESLILLFKWYLITVLAT